MRILGARIFSGKFQISKQMLTSWNYLKIKKKNRRMRILSARIFLSLLAGKLETFEQRLPWQELRLNMTHGIVCLKQFDNNLTTNKLCTIIDDNF